MNSDRRTFVAGNWKMNGLLDEAKAFMDAFGRNPAEDVVEVGLMPPFTLLHPMSERLAAMGISLGAQNVYYEDKGAFTGSICPMMLRDSGCHYVILGHSERRSIIGENNAQIRSKMTASWLHGLEPILCIGETLEQREQGITNTILTEQLAILKGAPKDVPLTVAYEPVWAIGTGVTASTDQIIETHAFVHSELQRLGHDARVLYGGSVKPENAEEILACDGVEGALVGGASLQADSFMAIVKAAAKVAS